MEKKDRQRSRFVSLKEGWKLKRIEERKKVLKKDRGSNPVMERKRNWREKERMRKRAI